MRTITATTPGEAWLTAVKLVNNEGHTVKDDGEDLKELLNVNLEITQPNKIDDIIKKFGDPKMLDWMKANFHDKTPIEGWGYSYGERIQDFSGINQLERVIKKLKSNPDSKSATINLMNPPKDKKHMPCVVAIDLKVRDSKLVGTVFIRSQDVVKKFYADIYSIGIMMEEITKELGIEIGKLVFNIVSLHSYDSDSKRVKELISYKN